MPQRKGSIRLFRFLGVEVFLHWSWFLVAVFEIQSRSGRYSSILWNVFEYLALFAIVLTHEYGHALACRQVGGRANQIVLWPLGGVAYVDPPQRPGATLWSIAAGPLVNVVLAPFSSPSCRLPEHSSGSNPGPTYTDLLSAILTIDLVLLVFNILPIYPLDGGQILRSLLWFVIGRARSLTVATLIGLVGIAGLFLFAIRSGSVWIGIMAVFLVLNCWAGLKHSLHLSKLAKLPHRDGFKCPWCHAAPPQGASGFVLSAARSSTCSNRRAHARTVARWRQQVSCVECAHSNPVHDWIVPQKLAAASS